LGWEWVHFQVGGWSCFQLGLCTAHREARRVLSDFSRACQAQGVSPRSSGVVGGYYDPGVFWVEERSLQEHCQRPERDSQQVQVSPRIYSLHQGGHGFYRDSLEKDEEPQQETARERHPDQEELLHQPFHRY